MEQPQTQSTKPRRKADPTRSARKSNAALSCILTTEPRQTHPTKPDRKRFHTFMRLINVQTEIDKQMQRQARLVEEMETVTKKLVDLIEQVKAIITQDAPGQTEEAGPADV
jgi:hypothetical protein